MVTPADIFNRVEDLVTEVEEFNVGLAGRLYELVDMGRESLGLPLYEDTENDGEDANPSEEDDG